MTPYYESPGVTLYHGDCVDVTEHVDDLDLTVTSPPYDELREYSGIATFNVKALANALFRSTKEGGVVVWIVADQVVDGSETGTSLKQALAFCAAGFRLHDTMIYLKDNPAPVGGSNRYYQAWEYMFVFSKGAPKTFNPIMVERRNAWNDKRTHRHRSVSRRKDGTFEPPKRVEINGLVKRTNVWPYVVSYGDATRDHIAYLHPATFPEKLAGDHIRTWSNPGDVVFDPFVGSGTTLKMARLLRRVGVGSDISEDYCEIAVQRLAQGVLEFS